MDIIELFLSLETFTYTHNYKNKHLYFLTLIEKRNTIKIK